jgi:hypothetical protein
MRLSPVVLAMLVGFIRVHRIIAMISFRVPRRQRPPINAVRHYKSWRRRVHNARRRLDNDRSWINDHGRGGDVHRSWNTNRNMYPSGID